MISKSTGNRQYFLTAAVQNIKRLGASFPLRFLLLKPCISFDMRVCQLSEGLCMNLFQS